MRTSGLAGQSGGPALALVAVLVAHQAAFQPVYRSADLGCVRFHQSVQNSVRVASGNRGLRQDSGRDGILTLMARDSLPGLRLEARFDSLMVWRDEPAGKHLANTDGVVGGRFLGLLEPGGRYTRLDVPFVPDEVAEITDLGAVMDDLLPPLPGTALDIGQRWQDSTGWVITRLSDQRGLQRYRLTATRGQLDRVTLPDSTVVEAQRVEREAGLALWDPARGLVRWERSIEAESSVPAGGAIPRGARTRVEQTIRLDRLPNCTP